MRGIVVDSVCLEPIPGALVSVLAKEMNVRHMSTDKKGVFEFENLMKEGLKIEITHLGYRIYSEYIENDMTTFDLGKKNTP